MGDLGLRTYRFCRGSNSPKISVALGRTGQPSDTDQIQAIGAAIVAVLTAWQARTSSKVRDLETRLASVETQRDQYRTKLRAAV
ncbi:Uncharacterised protein [Mycobacteroides abscessus subsp. bolletii]|nr:Uncharacterised protein [Mycobacteroides abscessus subsp. bolletii]SKF70653.1 Uncharacterised protein [Mycobacteroides abscessus subsp. bolletii]SPX82220.1 Uncharacterised protein [Mycobacteroides abscessus]